MCESLSADGSGAQPVKVSSGTRTAAHHATEMWFCRYNPWAGLSALNNYIRLICAVFAKSNLVYLVQYIKGSKKEPLMS